MMLWLQAIPSVPLHKHFFPGTGDYEDGPEICNDQEMDCYCIWLEGMINSGSICAGIGFYEHLPDAIHAAEDSAGFERWINRKILFEKSVK